MLDDPKADVPNSKRPAEEQEWIAKDDQIGSLGIQPCKKNKSGSNAVDLMVTTVGWEEDADGTPKASMRARISVRSYSGELRSTSQADTRATDLQVSP